MNNFIEIESGANASRVYKNVWVGSAPPVGPSVSKKFKHLVLCAIEYQPDQRCFHNTNVLSIGLYDDGYPMTESEKKLSMGISGKLNELIKSGDEILVTCFAGLNRSSLIASLALCLGEEKVNFKHMVNLIRFARGNNALSNPYFVNFLKERCEFINSHLL